VKKPVDDLAESLQFELAVEGLADMNSKIKTLTCFDSENLNIRNSE
jgi:hypothetical protein